MPKGKKAYVPMNTYYRPVTVSMRNDVLRELDKLSRQFLTSRSGMIAQMVRMLKGQETVK